MEDIELFVSILDWVRSHSGPILIPCNLCWDTTGLKLDLFDLFFTFFTMFLHVFALFFDVRKRVRAKPNWPKTNFRYRLGVNMGATVAQPTWDQSSGNATRAVTAWDQWTLNIGAIWARNGREHNNSVFYFFSPLRCAFFFVFSRTSSNMTILALNDLCWCRQSCHLDLFLSLSWPYGGPFWACRAYLVAVGPMLDPCWTYVGPIYGTSLISRPFQRCGTPQDWAKMQPQRPQAKV